jgi:hypothetical protein
MMKKSGTNESGQSRSRNIALGAGMGLVIGGGIDMLTNDSGWGLVIGILAGALVGYFVKFPLPVMEYPATSFGASWFRRFFSWDCFSYHNGCSTRI